MEERFELWRRRIGLPLGPLLGLIVYLLADGWPAEQRRLAAVLVFVIIYWITEAIPIPATALLGPALCALLGVAEVRSVLQPFANPIIFVFMGSFFLARAMTVNGLDRRVALGVLGSRFIGRSPGRIRLAAGAVAFLLSMWLSNTATVAMLFPIVLGISEALEGLLRRDGGAGAQLVPGYTTGLMLITAYAASIGGMSTPVGTPPNLVGLGLIDDLTGTRIPFFEWMLLALPVSVVMFVVLTILIGWLHPAPKSLPEGLAASVAAMRKEVPAWGRAQTFTLLAFLTAVVLWVFPGVVALFRGTDDWLYRLVDTRLHEGTVALLAASLLFLLPIGWNPPRGALNWKEAAHIDWGTILLFGGGLSMGAMMYSTGLAERMARGVLGTTGEPNVWVITAVAMLTASLLSETTSNLASATMLVPVTIAVAQAAGVSPLPPALGATLGASMGFMLPVSTPPNAIVYGSGRVSLLSMMRAGILLDVIGFVVLMVMLYWLCPLLGLV